MITPTFKDLVTGETHRATDEPDWGIFWWTEGNGSCDCNRAPICGRDDEMDAAMRREHPELLPHQSYCYGCKRFMAVDVEGDFEGLTKEQLLKELNRDYPKDVKRDEPCVECPLSFECWNYGKEPDPAKPEGPWRIVGWFDCPKPLSPPAVQL